jgi:hypothetical protein
MSLQTPVLTFAFVSGIAEDIANIEATLVTYSQGVSGGTW